MIEITLKETLQKKELSLAWIARRLNRNYIELMKFSNKKRKSIDLVLLEEICTLLNVKPGDIIEKKN